MNIVITGANRGIGLEFVRQYLERGEHVYATARQPDKAHDLAALTNKAAGKLRIFACDTSQEASVRAFAEKLGETSVDVLINNAGISGSWAGFLETNLEEVLPTFNTDTLGALRVTRALLPHLRRSEARTIINISSICASIAETTSSMLFGYRLAKAALNMATKALAQDLMGEKFTILAVHPGWVKTDMGGTEAPITPEESVRGMIAQFDRRDRGDTGSFFDYTGKVLPW